METSEKRKIIALMVVIGLLVSLTTFSNNSNILLSKAIEDNEIMIKTAKEKQRVTVHISGAVVNSGTYILESNTRVKDALSFAGGLLGNAKTDKINFARICTDEMHIKVPFLKVKKISRKSYKSKKAFDKSIVYINSASEKDFQKLQGIGPALAKNIVKYRNAYGPFKTLEQLKDVKGIGSAKYLLFQERIRL